MLRRLREAWASPKVCWAAAGLLVLLLLLATVLAASVRGHRCARSPPRALPSCRRLLPPPFKPPPPAAAAPGRLQPKPSYLPALTPNPQPAGGGADRGGAGCSGRIRCAARQASRTARFYCLGQTAAASCAAGVALPPPMQVLASACNWHTQLIWIIHTTRRFEYMGSLFSNRPGGGFFCAGTLIAPRIFMTAGGLLHALPTPLIGGPPAGHGRRTCLCDLGVLAWLCEVAGQSAGAARTCARCRPCGRLGCLQCSPPTEFSLDAVLQRTAW